MKKRNLTLLILINIMVGSAGADELGSATESAAIQSLLQSVAQQQELMAIQTEQLERQEQQISEQSERLQSMEDQLRQLVMANNGATMSPSEHPGEVIASDSESVSQQRQTAERLRDPEIPIEAEPAGQPGYLLIPGTGSSMKLGGYAKMSIVQSFDPVGSTDRFAPGTIPVPEDPNGLENQANLNARQSRLNVDMRRDSTIGPLRAFIEGDFAGAGDTFRLRHAYGQLGKVLAGQTWSTMVDKEANPEEIDFEGLNGRVNVRQPQLRYFPSFGENLQLAIALEDPNPDVTGEQV